MQFHLNNIIRILLFCLVIYFVQFNELKAQTTYQLPPNQPEQDACNALQICGNSFYTPYSYTGTGRKLDLDQTPCFTGPGGGEKNSVWLQIHILQAGNVVFKIKPVNPDDDYDFAVIKITGKSCSSFTSKDVVGCNYNSNVPGSNIDGVIGVSDTSRTPFIKEGTFGNSFAQAVFAKSDDVFLIMINNFGNYVSGGPSKGFTIDFSGSTAIFYNNGSPRLNNIDVPCNNASSITIRTTTDILCSSIAADGSDFATNAPAKIISAAGINCTDRGGYTNSIVINFSSVLPPGSYTISAKKGVDNNTLTGLCNNDLLLPSDTVSFIVKQNAKEVMDNESICYQQLPYSWNGMQIEKGGNNVASYTTASAFGCDSITILNLSVTQAPQQLNISKTICDGDSYILPWDSTINAAGTYVHHYTNTNGCDSLVESINVDVTIPKSGNVDTRDSTIQTGFCQGGFIVLTPKNNFINYLWNTGESSDSITVNIAGTYALVATDTEGCITIDTFVVAAYQRPLAAFSNIEKLCGDTVKTLDAGAGFMHYLWSNGSNAETITTNKPGKFWVTLTSTRNCMNTDTVNVVAEQKPANFLVSDMVKCVYKPITLIPSNNFSSYQWSNGSISKSINVSTGGLYWLNVTDYNGCTGRDSVTVIDSACLEYFFMPTAFTPNNDQLNDIFKPAFAGPLSGYHLSIYNRWGKLIFSTKDPLTGWDGTLGGFQQPMGAYIWICSYTLDGQSPHTEKGTVTLIR